MVKIFWGQITKRILKKPSETRSSHDIKLLKKTTSNIKFFEDLQKNKGSEVLDFLCKNMAFLSLEAHETVFKEGSFGTIFYIILKGKVSLCKQEKRGPEEGVVTSLGIPKQQTNVKSLKKLKVDLNNFNTFIFKINVLFCLFFFFF